MVPQRLADRVINRNAVNALPALARGDAGDNLRSVIDHVFGEGGCFSPGDTLYYNLSMFIG
jgi:hypothetical protein